MRDRGKEKINILFVCLGNICRSPLAEGVFRSAVTRRGLDHLFHVDSAGTGAWHIGESPDARMRETARSNGVSLNGQTARQFTRYDFEAFDHIFAMDKDNLNDILYLDQSGVFTHKVRLFREADPEPGDYQVPDPYYGRGDGFQKVFDIVHRTVEDLISKLTIEYSLD